MSSHQDAHHPAGVVSSGAPSPSFKLDHFEKSSTVYRSNLTGSGTTGSKGSGGQRMSSDDIKPLAGLPAAPFYRQRVSKAFRTGIGGSGGPMSESPSSLAWGPGGHGELNQGMHAERMSFLSKEVMRLSQLGPVYLDEYGELSGTSTSVNNVHAMEMEEVMRGFSTERSDGVGKVDLDRFFTLASAMAQTVHSLNDKGVFLRVTATDNWLLSRPASSLKPIGEAGPGPSTAASRSGREVPYLRLSPFVMTAVDPMAFDVRPEDLVGAYSANIAPELVRGSLAAVDPFATDVYTLCATLYHVLTGHHCLSDSDSPLAEGAAPGRLLAGVHAALAAKPTPPRTYREDIPEELERILMKGLEKQQVHRYMNCLSLAMDLDKLGKALRRRRRGSGPLEGPLMQVGATDHLARLSFPDRLFGREEAEEDLKTALAKVIHGGNALLRVCGDSGTGKTSLVEETMRPSRNPWRAGKGAGILVSVKVHPTADRFSSIVRDFLDGLLRPLLLAQADKAPRWRKEIFPLIGDTALSALRYHLDPDVCDAFGLPPKVSPIGPGGLAEPINPLAWEAAEAAILRVVSRMAKNFRPLILFFDDVQWLDADLKLVQALVRIVPETPGLCVVCAHRPMPEGGEVPAFFDSELKTMLDEKATTIETGPLSLEALGEMLATTLGPNLEEGGELSTKRKVELENIASFIDDACGSNPLAVRQVLLALRDAAHHALTFNWDKEQWDFDLKAAREQAEDLDVAPTVTHFPRKVLELTTPDERTVLIAAACVIADGPFSIPLLAASAGITGTKTQATVVSLVRRKILQPALAFADENAGDVDVPAKLRFTHDSWIEASLSLCPDEEQGRMHYALAMRLHDLEAGQGTYVHLVASNIKKALEAGWTPSGAAEKRKIVNILHQAGLVQFHALNSGGAITSLETCRNLMGAKAWEEEHDRMREIMTSLYDAYLMDGQLVEAVAVADLVAGRSLDELEDIRSAQMQMSAAGVIDPPRGVQRLREVMKKYLNVDLDEESRSELLESRDVFRSSDYAPRLKEATPSKVEAALQTFLAESIYVSYSSGPTFGIAVTLAAVDLARKHGPTPMLAFPMMAVSLFCCEVMNFDCARQWRDEGDALVERSDSPYHRSTAEMSKHCSSHFFAESWQASAEALIDVSIRARDLAFYETAAFGLAHALTQAFWSSMRLRTLVEAGRNVAPSCEKRTPQAYVFAVVPLQAALNLTAPVGDRDPTVLSGLSQKVSRDLPMQNNQWISCLLALNAIFNRPLWPVWEEQRTKDILNGALIQNITISFLATLAIFEGLRDGKDVTPEDHDFVAQSFARFEAFVKGAVSKGEFAVMLCVMRAAELSIEAPYGKVLEALNEAIELASVNSLHLLEGLASEAAVTYILRSDPRNNRSAQGYLIQAYGAYAAWGAIVKCQSMLNQYPHLRPHVAAPQLPATVSSLPSSNLFSISAESQSTKPVSSTRSAAMVSLSTESQRHSSERQRTDTHTGSPAGSAAAHEGSVSSSKEAAEQVRREGRSSLDVASLLAASHSWQTETDTHSMVLSLVKVLLQHSGASFGCIALSSEGRGLVLKAAGSATAMRGDLDLAIGDPRAAEIAPVTILDYVARTGQVAGFKELAICAGSDGFFADTQPAAIFASPIRFANQLRGVLYFDSPFPSAFSATDRTIIASLASQAVLALERTMAAQELEAKIIQRTAELSRQNVELEVARKTAVEAKEAETRFLLRMSHELRTPSNSIIVLADLLQEAPVDGLYKEYLTQIKNSSRDLLAILTDVLDFSRLSSGSIVINPAPFRVRSMVETSIAGVAEQASAKGLELCYTNVPSDDLPTEVIGDEFRCRQILLNLLSNAIRFTEEPGFVCVATSYRHVDAPSTDHPQIELRIDVKDNGIGISKEKQSKLFQSFSQVHSAKHVGGSGLGLAISRALAQRMGGDTTVESEPGVGSTFTVTVKVEAGAPIEQRLKYDLFKRQPNRRRVLASAGSLIMRRTLCNILSDFGADADEVESIDDLEPRLAQGSVDFVVVDPLSALSENVRRLDALTRYPYVGMIIIGNAPRSQMQPTRLIDDPRTIILTRPSKSQALYEALLKSSELPTPIPTSNGIATETIAKGVPTIKPTRSSVKVPQAAGTEALPDLSKECPLSILIVDDNAVNRLVFKRVVQRLGYENAEFAIDGEAAVKICSERRFDVCLMDEEMPKMNGTQAMRVIHQEHPNDAPFIAMVTASAMPGDKERFLDRGFDAYLPKPLMIPDLVEVIRTAHSRRPKSNGRV